MGPRLFKSHHMELYSKESFGMGEAQPLAIGNVMFLFLMLGFGLGASLAIGIVEVMVKRLDQSS